MKKYTFKKVKGIFKKEGWKLLSKHYDNNKQLLNVICNKGHKLKINLNNFLSGWRCKECSKIYLRGKNHHFWKGGLPKCVDCGKRVWWTSERCDSCKALGNKNSNWQGGINENQYPLIFNNKLKEKIRKRDGYKCLCCGITEYQHKDKFNKVLCVHHVDYNKQNCEEKNLITLCNKCNIKVNKNRDYWYAYFTYVMENL